MKNGWKGKVRHELIEYGFNVIYLTLVFASFTLHQRLVLAAHDITYTNYGFALIEALILGKVIMVGRMLHLGRVFGREKIAALFFRPRSTMSRPVTTGAGPMLRRYFPLLGVGC